MKRKNFIPDQPYRGGVIVVEFFLTDITAVNMPEDQIIRGINTIFIGSASGVARTGIIRPGTVRT